MTQSIIATGDFRSLELPASIEARLPNQPLALEVSQLLFPGKPCFQIADKDSSEADALFDELYAKLEGSEAPDQAPIIGVLKQLADRGSSIACWYASDFDDLPCFDAWPAFFTEVVQQAGRMPPEVYARLRG